MTFPSSATWRPWLRPGVLIAPAGEGRWQARWDFDEVTFLSGSLCDSVLPWLPPLLDGTRTIAELERAASGRCSLPSLREVLQCLDEQRLLCESVAPIDATLLATEAVANSASTPDSTEAIDRIVVCGRGLLADRIARSAAEHALKVSINTLLAVQSELAIDRSSPTSILPVVVETDWTGRDLEEFNATCLQRAVPWLLVAAWNRRLLVGPLILPGVTACYVCYRQRLSSHRKFLAAYGALDCWQRTRAESPEAQPLLPGMAELAAAWTGLELWAFATRTRPSRLTGRVLVYQPDETRLTLETVLRIPWCRACALATARGADHA